MVAAAAPHQQGHDGVSSTECNASGGTSSFDNKPSNDAAAAPLLLARYYLS